MKAVILAAGKKRWDGDCPRHLVEIAGEPLLSRTLRQLEERGCEGIVVTDIPENMEAVPGCFVPENSKTIWNTMLSTRGLWEGKTLILLGDVVYLEEHFDLMFDHAEDAPVCFDSFALLFGEGDRDHVAASLETLADAGGYFNMLWRGGFFPVIQYKGHIDMDAMSYYERFLEENPWAKS